MVVISLQQQQHLQQEQRQQAVESSLQLNFSDNPARLLPTTTSADTVGVIGAAEMIWGAEPQSPEGAVMLLRSNLLSCYQVHLFLSFCLCDHICRRQLCVTAFMISPADRSENHVLRAKSMNFEVALAFHVILRFGCCGMTVFLMIF